MSEETTGVDNQPLASLRWLPASDLHANDYNPNRVAPNELNLLKVSLLCSGWTQPVVAREDGEIVDGFHRWTLASTDPEVAALTNGLVPVVTLLGTANRAEQIAATVRHNRARGSHYVLRMADITAALIYEHGIDPQDLETKLGMEPDEVQRLLINGKVTERHANEDGSLSSGWTPGDRNTYSLSSTTKEPGEDPPN